MAMLPSLCRSRSSISPGGPARYGSPAASRDTSPCPGYDLLPWPEFKMLQLYGNPRSRAIRCLWMLEEVGQPYQLVDKSTRADDLQASEYLRLNPNARIPTLVDGDVVLWESMAINLYLAQKYDGPMHAGADVLGLAAQWSFWAMLEIEHLLLELLGHRILLPEFSRDISV